MSDPGHPRLPGLLLMNRNFVLLWFAAGICAVGNHLSEMALLHELGGVDRPDVTRVQALMTFSFFLPFAMIAPLAGWWSDRFPRRTTMVLSDVMRGCVMLSLVVLVPTLLKAGWGDYTLIIPLFMTGLFASFFSPARLALLPSLIRPDQFVRANALMSAVSVIGGITSAMLGGFLVDQVAAGRIRIEFNFLAAASAFGISAVLLVCMSMRLARPAPQAHLTTMLGPLKEGFRYVRAHRRIAQVILLGTTFWAGAGVVVSVVPAIVREVFAGSYTELGIYRGLLAVGLASGAAVLTVLGASISIPLLVLGALSGAAFWVLLLDFAFVFSVWGGGAIGMDPDWVAALGKFVSAICLIMIGAHGAGLLVTVNVCIQRFVPNERRGRVFGVSDMCTMGAMCAATGLIGLPKIPFLDRLVPILLLLVACGMFTALFFAWRIYRHGEEQRPTASIVMRIASLYARFWSRLKLEGRCTIPLRGPAIVAANHASGIDPILIQAVSQRPIAWLVAEEHYRVPVANWFMRLVDCIPVNREKPQKSAIAAALRHLNSGGVLGVFPAGRFARPGEPPPAPRIGLAALALRTGAAIVPCHVSGTRYFESPLRAYAARHRGRLRFGRAIRVTPTRGDTEAEQRLLEAVMREIDALGQASSIEEESRVVAHGGST